MMSSLQPDHQTSPLLMFLPLLTLLTLTAVSSLRADEEENVRSVHHRRMIDGLKSSNIDHESHRPVIDTLWNSPISATEAVALSLSACHEPTRQLLRAVESLDGSTTGPIPPILQDDAIDPFLRSNLGLWIAQLLIRRQMLDEAMAVLDVVNAQEVAEPAGYHFHVALCASQLSNVLRAIQSLDALTGLSNVPRRYLAVARQIRADLQNSDPGSLDSIARQMKDIGRRFELRRSDGRVAEMEDDVIKRLDVLIDDLERRKQVEQEQSSNTMKPTNPNQDDQAATVMGKGEVAPHRITDRRSWGNLPAKERERALQEMGRDMPGPYRGAVQQYFRQLSKTPRSSAP